MLKYVIVEFKRIRSASLEIPDTTTQIECTELANLISKSLCGCIVTVDDLYEVRLHGVQLVCRVQELEPEEEQLWNNTSHNELIDEDNPCTNHEEYTLPDNFRGLVTEHTVTYVTLDPVESKIELLNPIAKPLPGEQMIKDIVEVVTSDEEVFPVKRRLLRPCLALTAVVQAGRGKYKHNHVTKEPLDSDHACEDMSNQPGQITVAVDACTFDRVLLYLEHEARGEAFRFDPLLAQDLLQAAKVLGTSSSPSLSHFTLTVVLTCTCQRSKV